MVAMLVLNLAVWVLGAELLFPDKQIEHLDDLPNLLSTVLGEPGRLLFYAGIFAAIYTSIIGHATGLGSLGTHAWLRWRGGAGADRARLQPSSLLSLDRDFDGDPAARLDPAGHAGLRGADAGRQQRPGHPAAAAGRRVVVDHRQLAADRPRAPQSLVGERGDGDAVRAGRLFRGARRRVADRHPGERSLLGGVLPPRRRSRSVHAVIASVASTSQCRPTRCSSRCSLASGPPDSGCRDGCWRSPRP